MAAKSIERVVGAGRIRARATGALRIVVAFAFVAGLVGIVLHLTLRDGEDVLAPVYYALPLPLIVLGSLFGAVVSSVVKDRWRARLGFALTIGSFGLLAAVDGYWRRSEVPARAPSDRDSSWRICVWNVLSGKLGRDALTHELATLDDDLIVLIEARGPIGAKDALARSFPGRHVLALPPYGMVLAARGELALERHVPLGSRSHLALVTLELRAHRYMIAVADIRSAPTISRGPALARLREELDSLAGGDPVILLGDFNTPRRSVHFDELRRGFAHAFESAGRGVPYTWPLPFPALDLDHVWVDRRLEVMAAATRLTGRSDHLPVHVTLAAFPSR
ncbi:MAG: endonuclease/exonuclease/phosphatase family protein [Planctomycetota bacterium]